MASVVPLRRSPRLAEKERVRKQQKVTEFQQKFRNQIADLYDAIGQLGHVINNDDGT